MHNTLYSKYICKYVYVYVYADGSSLGIASCWSIYVYIWLINYDGVVTVYAFST